MKTLFFVITLAAVATSQVAQAQAQRIIFRDDFSAGASPLWGNESGGWSASGGFYDAAGPSTYPNAYSSLPFELGDHTIAFDVEDVQDGGVWLHATPAAGPIGLKGVLLVTGGHGLTGDGVYWHIVTGSDYGPLLGEVRGLFQPGQSDASFRVTVTGDTYELYVNDSPTPTTRLSTPLFPRGRTAMYDYSPQRVSSVVLSTPVPEPATWALFVAGGVGILAWARRRTAKG